MSEHAAPSGARAPAHRGRRILEGLLGIPVTEGNIVDVLRNGDEIFPAMLAAIDESTRTVDLTTYVYWQGDIAIRFADSLSARALAGVRVRILLDAVGAYAMNRDLVDQMEQAGCDVRWFRLPGKVPPRETNNRTHRKVLVCDEDVAFIGGVGIASEWEGNARNADEWRDTHLRLRGPCVDGLRACFVSNWAETGGPICDEHDIFPEQPQVGTSLVQVVQSPSQVGWSELATCFAALLHIAQEHVRITNAYFVPDDSFVDLLCAAVQRGTEVDVLVPGEHIDKRVVQAAGEYGYAELMAAGVRIWRYAPTMLHAKVMTVDGRVATVGSANFDNRSLRLNEEANVVIFDAAVVDVLDAHFAEDLARSVQVDPADWQRRGLVQRVSEKLGDAIGRQL